MMEKFLAFVLILVSFKLIVCDKFVTRIPLTAVEPGIPLTPIGQTTKPTGIVKLEAFLDLNCPYSYEAFQRLRPLAKYYEDNANVVIIVHIQVLPYHRNSMLCTQGMFTLMDLKPEGVLDYINATMLQWEYLGVANTREKTEFEVLGDIAKIAVASTGVEGAKFEKEIDGYREHVKKVFKYAVKRGVAGTPAFFINGMELLTEDDLSLTDWMKYIDGIVATLDNSLQEWD